MMRFRDWLRDEVARLRANLPTLAATAGFAAMFAGITIWFGVGQALTVCGSIVFAAAAWTYNRGGFEV